MSEELQEALDRLEGKLDKLMAHLGVGATFTATTEEGMDVWVSWPLHNSECMGCGPACCGTGEEDG